MKALHDRAADKPRRTPTFSDLLARAVADKLERDPSLLRIAIENIDRWLARGVISAPNRFLRWRDFSPFAGVLSSAERRAIIRQCRYSH